MTTQAPYPSRPTEHGRPFNGRRSPTLELWHDGQPITHWPAWAARQRAAGWPPRALDAIRLALVPEHQLSMHATLDALRRGEL